MKWLNSEFIYIALFPSQSAYIKKKNDYTNTNMQA